jgi:hypothetical protein
MSLVVPGDDVITFISGIKVGPLILDVAQKEGCVLIRDMIAQCGIPPGAPFIGFFPNKTKLCEYLETRLTDALNVVLNYDMKHEINDCIVAKNYAVFWIIAAICGFCVPYPHCNLLRNPVIETFQGLLPKTQRLSNMFHQSSNIITALYLHTTEYSVVVNTNAVGSMALDFASCAFKELKKTEATMPRTVDKICSSLGISASTSTPVATPAGLFGTVTLLVRDTLFTPVCLIAAVLTDGWAVLFCEHTKYIASKNMLCLFALLKWGSSTPLAAKVKAVRRPPVDAHSWTRTIMVLMLTLAVLYINPGPYCATKKTASKQHIDMPTPKAAEPKPVPVAEPKPVPVAEPKPVPVAEPKPVPVAEPVPVPVAEPKPVPVPEPKPIPVAEPKPFPVAEAKPNEPMLKLSTGTYVNDIY